MLEKVPGNKEALPMWRTVDVKELSKGSTENIVIECNGSVHRKLIYDPEMNTYEETPGTWECDPTTHNFLFD